MLKTHSKMAFANAKMRLELLCNHEENTCQMFNMKRQEVEVAVTLRADNGALHAHRKAEMNLITPSAH